MTFHAALFFHRRNMCSILTALFSVFAVFIAATLSSRAVAYADTTTGNIEPHIDEVITVDVLVVGGNSAGVGAAVTASDGGKNRVLVMEPLTMIGGMGAAGGVGLMNQGCGVAGVTGLARNHSLLCGEYYYGAGTGRQVLFPSMNVSAWAFWTLLNSTGTVETRLGCRPVSTFKSTSPTDGDGCISRVDFLCEGDTARVSVKSSYVIDASYDGDIMVQAGGIEYAYGREARNVYNESLAGTQLIDFAGESFDKQNLSLSALWPNGTVLPYVDADPMPPAGTGDDRVMAYQYFACLSTSPGNRVPLHPPPGYNPQDFELLLRQTLGAVANGRYPHGPPLGYFTSLIPYDPVVEQVTGFNHYLACCGLGPVDSDQPDLNRGWPVANYSRRLELAQKHRYYIQGSYYFLATDPRVPNGTRADAQRFGYCRDEYSAHGNFPPQLYVRISNRLKGVDMLTQNNIIAPRVKPTGVAMGCWTFDQHTVSRHAVPDPKNSKRRITRNEGYMRVPLNQALSYTAGSAKGSAQPKAANSTEAASSHTQHQYRHLHHHHHHHHDDSEANVEPPALSWAGTNWYDVPFGTMVPRRGQASNLLVPVVISASSVAYSSTRIENMFMDMGSAAGVAVAQLIESEKNRLPGGAARYAAGTCPVTPVQDVNITAVQDVLLNRYHQRVHGPPTGPVPGSRYYTVTGAGDDAWDGTYEYNGVHTDGRPVFVDEANSSKRLYSYDNTWRLAVEGKEIFYTAGPTPDSDLEPPLTGWAVANGTAPAPLLNKSQTMRD